MRFVDKQAVFTYVQRELAAALPPGWQAHVHYRQGRSHLPAVEATIADLEWKIFVPPDDFTDYELHVSGDLQTFTIIYGNACPGPVGPWCYVYQSLTIFAENLNGGHDSLHLGDVIRRMVGDQRSYPMNRRDLT